MKEKIIIEGLRQAARHGVESVTFQSVADAMGTKRQNINYHFASVDALREAVESAAVAHNITPVIVQMIAGPRAARHVLTASQLKAAAEWIEGRANA